MTPKRLKEIKAQSIYGKEDCRHDDNCSSAVKCLPELIEEIERLVALCERLDILEKQVKEIEKVLDKLEGRTDA